MIAGGLPAFVANSKDSPEIPLPPTGQSPPSGKAATSESSTRVRLAFDGLRLEAQPNRPLEEKLAETLQLIRHTNLEPFEKAELRGKALRWLLASPSPSETSVVRLLAGLEKDDALPVIVELLRGGPWVPKESALEDFSLIHLAKPAISPAVLARAVRKQWLYRKPRLEPLLTLAQSLDDPPASARFSLQTTAYYTALFQVPVSPSKADAEALGAEMARSGISPMAFARRSAEMEAEEANLAIHGYLFALAQESPSEMASAARVFEQSRLLPKTQSLMVAALLNYDAETCTNWTAGLSPAQRDKLLDSAFVWYEDQPNAPAHLVPTARGARYYLENRGQGRSPNIDLLAEAVRRVPDITPSEVQQWTGALPAKDRQRLIAQAQEMSIRATLSRDPALAIQQALQLPVEQRGSVMLPMLQLAAAQNFPATLAALQGTSDPALKSQAIAGILCSDTAESPALNLSYATRKAASVGFANEKEGSGEAKKVVSRLIEEAVNFSPSEAVNLLPEFHHRETRDSATLDIAKVWAAKDPAAASEWVATLPAGKLRAEALSMVLKNAYDQPEEVVRNLDALEDPKLKQEILDGLRKKWDAVIPGYIETLSPRAPR